MKPQKVEAEEWMEVIRQEEAEALAELHQELFRRMRERAGARITTTLDMPDPETSEQIDIVEDEGTWRIEFRDGSALVIGSEVYGFSITLGIHSSRLSESDPFQGFRFIVEDDGQISQHLPKEILN